jgi:Fe-S-cluster-containing dehydrogenase component/anaerobic selenocysteine-containing dehydrogenase
MINGINRRDFLKALGLGTTATAASACGLDNNYYRTPIEEVLPYVVRPDQVIPGNPTFFATTVTTGPNAFPVLARHRDGRVINIGANKLAPHAAAVPVAALFELQRHFSPDRVSEPQAAGAALEWDAALSRLADAVKAARAAGKKVAYLGPYRSGAIVELLADYTAGEAVYFEPLGRDAEASAAEKLFGKRVLPAYDLSKAHYVLSFGADFLGTWGNRVVQGQYSSARNPNIGQFVARYALVSAHRGQSGANADDWFAAIPGSEAKVALAIAKLVADRIGYSGPLSGVLAAADVAGAVAASGLQQADLEGIAAQFAAGPAVALPGGVVGASRAGTDLALATYVLNIVSGNSGVTFGMGPVYAGPVHGYARVQQLIGDMQAGAIGVLLIDEHANPVHTLPTASGFGEALAKVGLVVGLSSHPDETNATAGLILPTSDVIEDWGDEEPQVGLHLIRQPGQTPLGNTRSLGDILLATARAAGLQVAAAPAPPAAVPAAPGAPAPVPAPVVAATLGFTAENWREYIKARWQRDTWPAAGTNDNFADFWWKSLANGFVDKRSPLLPAVPVDTAIAIADGAVQGSGDLHLVAYPHPFRFDGRYSNQPWAQETPDPLTGLVWDSWVEIHPTTADRLGVADNDLVTIKTDTGSINVGVQRIRTIREDVIGIAFGQGHTANGRYADGWGDNVVKLLAAVQDGSGNLAWTQAKASLTPTGQKAELVGTFGSDDDHHRNIGVVVDAVELARIGDTPQATPGELTGIEEEEIDDRLKDAKLTDFYPLTDHPNYRFGMTIDTNACTGCGVCAIACYAENNLPIVGKWKVNQGREMGWLRIDRFFPDADGRGPKDIRFVPMLCQHCAHAPCESVCPVVATYHTIDGLNAMVYNRCVGTRYCANNCPYKARRFNWHTYTWPEPFNLQLNPDVSTRTMGVMEKCTFCVQRIRATKSAYRNQGFTNLVPDEALRTLPACVESCPSQALTFGNINDPESVPAMTRRSARTQFVLADLNTFPAINYLGRATYHPPEHAEPDGAADAGEPATTGQEAR